MLKTLERLIDRYLRDGPLTKHQIHPKQHAYQPRKSAESALHQIVTYIEKAITTDLYVLGGVLDLAGAFNHMTFKSIISSCKEHGTMTPLHIGSTKC